MSDSVVPVVKPGVGEVVAGAVRRPTRWIDFAMSFHNRPAVVDFAHTLTQVTNEFVEGCQLFLRGFVLVEVADQTDSQGDVVEIIAVHVAAVNLTAPTTSNFNFPVARRRSVANHKLISQAIGHFADLGVVIFESFRISLTRATVVDHNVAPPPFFDRRLVNLFADRL